MYTCEDCGRSYQSWWGLRWHAKQKHGKILQRPQAEKTVECEICGKKFDSKQHLMFHKTTHLQAQTQPQLQPQSQPQPQTQPKTFKPVFQGAKMKDKDLKKERGRVNKEEKEEKEQKVKKKKDEEENDEWWF